MRLTFLLAALLLLTQCRSIQRRSDAEPVPHDIWDALLRQHVSVDGMVRYADFMADTAQLDAYLRLLASAHPDAKRWTRNEQMAYWINAYNAFTLRLTLRHYPVASIRHIRPGIPWINSVWDIRFIRIQGRRYDLNNIEHNILRPVFRDARIHAAINCASISCPRLRPEAYRADRLDAQLDEAMRDFINDPLRNRVGPERAEVSPIFQWFARDFKRDAGSVRAYLNRYAEQPVSPHAPVSFTPYDWRLNNAQPHPVNNF